ncbi:hypothetical protein A6X21_03150 [Planctopirus hydrillae]|uniref:Uncharacterized protein n=1 Tax=Planctopirus hydrillae TaxID=1841610 RepID=A0A1C3EN80_9PLAN|nr:hypothetical protein A6X21_03150 [Planctopirus hydrillae]
MGKSIKNICCLILIGKGGYQRDLASLFLAKMASQAEHNGIFVARTEDETGEFPGFEFRFSAVKWGQNGHQQARNPENS